MTSDETKEQVRLIELDYDRTNKFIESIVGSGYTIRGWAITLSLALLGVAFDRNLWQACILAGVVTVTFALIDAYYSWLYSQALRHAAGIERVLQTYYVMLGRGTIDSEAQKDFQVEIEVHKFGLLGSLTRFRMSSVRDARPAFVLAVLYGTLLIVSTVSTLLLGFTKAGVQPERAGSVLIQTSR